MDFQQKAALAICGAAVGYIWYRRYRTLAISDVPGPKNPSWIYGHQWWWQSEDGADLEKMLLKEYGSVVRWNASLGEERLWIADPKAAHHMLHGTNYLYQKPRYLMELMEVVFDKGIFSVEGDVHKRQRRAMAPAFGLVETKALYSYFLRGSNALADKWHDVIMDAESEHCATIEVRSWLSKATLDVIGAGVFDYDFGALENSDNKLTKSYKNLIHSAFGILSKERMFMLDVVKWAPRGLSTWVSARDKSPGMVNIRKNRSYAHEVTRKLIEDKKQELKDGASRRDILSLLVKANTSLRQDCKSSDEEIIAQVRSIMFAGHETTAKSLTFALWELANDQHLQRKLRAEIVETLEKIRARGDSDFSASDFDSMPFLIAFGKEVLRVYPPATELVRVASKDDVLPLSKPVIGVSGKVYKELPIAAGTRVSIAVLGYNWNKDVWGPDAYEFRPERWLDMNKRPENPVGLYGNLATFSGGHRGCIGWRFAVIELHTFLVTIVRQFDFSLPNDGRKVRKMRPLGNIVTVVAGEEEKGPQLWLKVTALKNE